VQALPWVVNWFGVMCESCHNRFNASDDAPLAAAYDGNDFRGDSAPDAEAFFRVLRARMSEPPLLRQDAQNRR